MIDVSVIIPVYNVSDYLKECLDSIINQTLNNIEIICIDDGSTDNSLDILKEYSKKDNRIKVISQENKGLGATRNVGMKIAVGKYIFFMDSDDYLRFDALELLVDNAELNNSDFVCFRFYNLSSDGNIKKNHLFNYKKHFNELNKVFNYKDASDFVLLNGFNAWAKLYRKDFLDKYSFTFPENIAFEDVLYHIQVMLKASRISYTPEFLYYYRDAPQSIVNTPKNAFDIFTNIDLVEEYLIDNNYIDEFKIDFDYFKMKRMHYHLLLSYSEEYFQITKKRCESIKHFDSFSKVNLDRLNLILESDNFIEYLIKLDKYDVDRFRKANKRLRKKNKKLKRQNEELLNSSSWKITKPLRKLKNMK